MNIDGEVRTYDNIGEKSRRWRIMRNNMLIKDKLADIHQRAIQRRLESHETRRVKDASLENGNFNSLAEYVYIQATADGERS